MPLNKRISFGAIFLLVAVIGFFSYQFGSSYNLTENKTIKKDLSALKMQLDLLSQENTKLKQTLEFSQRDLQIQIEAKKNLAQYLKSMQEHNTELTQNVNLYHAVSGTSLGKSAIEIKTFQIYPTQDGNTFRYLAILSKNATKSHEQVKGALTMVIVGTLGTEKIHLPVKYVNSGRDDGLSFSFQTIQELSGELSLPPGFIAQEVHVKVIVDNQKMAAIEQAYPWFVA